MGFEKVSSVDADTSVNIGGVNRKTGKANPEQVEGYFIGTKTGIPNKFNPEKPDCLHILQTPKGNVGVWGKSHLNPQLAKVILGTMVRISAAGSRPSKKGNDQLLFLVEQDKTNRIDVDTVQADPGSNWADDMYDAETGEYTNGPDAPAQAYTAPTPPKVAAKPPTASSASKTAALLAGIRNKSA